MKKDCESIMNCFEAVENEYMNEQTPLCQKLHDLPMADRRLMILYAETGSIRDCAQTFNMSYGGIWKRINKIKNILR